MKHILVFAGIWIFCHMWLIMPSAVDAQLPAECNFVCDRNYLRKLAIDGQLDTILTPDIATVQDFCCLEVMDPGSLFAMPSAGAPDPPVLTGPMQNYKCNIWPRDHGDTASNEIHVGDGMCCSIARSSGAYVPSYDFSITAGNDTCTNMSSICQTQVILTVRYTDGRLPQTRRIDSTGCNFVFYGVSLIEVNYQTCGDDELMFSLPFLSDVPLNYSCGDTTAMNPGRQVDEACMERLSNPPLGVPTPTAGRQSGGDSDGVAAYVIAVPIVGVILLLLIAAFIYRFYFRKGSKVDSPAPE